MSTRLLKSALELPPAERILLVERVWDSLVDAGADVALTPAQLSELKRREANLEATGPSGDEWPVVKSRILGKKAKR